MKQTAKKKNSSNEWELLELRKLRSTNIFFEEFSHKTQSNLVSLYLSPYFMSKRALTPVLLPYLVGLMVSGT